MTQVLIDFIFWRIIGLASVDYGSGSMMYGG